LRSKILKWSLISAVVIIILSLAGWLYLQGYILDREPPEVSIIRPSRSRVITLSPKNPRVKEVFQIKAVDNRALDRVVLLLNDSQIKSFGREDKLSFEWETKNRGRYVFKALAYDRAKNKKESKPVTITVKVEGILPADYTGFQKPVKVYVGASNVFLREGPSVTYGVIKILKHREEVLVFGKWASKSPDEAITTDRVNLITPDGGSIELDRGKALLIVKREDPYYIVSVQIDNRKLTGKLPVSAVKSISDRPWYYVRTKEGKEGWVFGEFLGNVEGSSE